MKIDQSPNWIKRFLLGELPEADQTAIERELLADREKFEQVCAVEDDLIDSYLRKKMSRGDLERFEIHYLASQYNRERVASAQILIAEIDRIARGRVTAGETDGYWWKQYLDSIHWPQPALGVALVLAILFASGALWLYLERARLLGEIAKIENEARVERASFKERQQELELRNQGLERARADERQRYEESRAALEEQLRIQQPSLNIAVLSFLLTPAPVRGEKTQPSLTLPLLTGRVRFLMELNSYGYAGYQVSLQTVEGREILRGPAGKLRLGKNREFASLTIQAGKLTTNDYILILSGQTADGREEEIDRYFLRIS
jgi:hypothetical protein